MHVRKISADDINICCVYPAHRSVQLKNFVINEDENSRKFCIIGVGWDGLRIVEDISKISADYYPLVVGQEYKHLMENKVSNKLLLTLDRYSDLSKKATLLSMKNRIALSKFVSYHNHIYVVATLDEETIDIQAVPKMIKHLKKIGRKVTLIVVKPFLFMVRPGDIRNINESIEEMAKCTDKIFVFFNEDVVELKCDTSFIDKAIFLLIENEYTTDDKVVTNLVLSDFLKEVS